MSASSADGGGSPVGSVSETTKMPDLAGRRVPDDEWFFWQAEGKLKPGDFGKVSDDENVFQTTWFVVAPDGGRFQLASPHHPDSAGRYHEVEEHEDGTITVEPRPDNSNSILSPNGWHGWIYRGVWR